MILLMGIAGSGKGTQGKLLCQTRGYQIISTGELLRSYGSADQHARMHAGEILGDEEVTELLSTALDHFEDPNNTILDGYPRTIAQSDWLLTHTDRFHINYVLHLKASKQAVKERLQARGRTDDYNEAIEARFKEYEEETVPILDHLRSKGIEVVEINAERPIEDVHRDILEVDSRHKQEA